MKCSRCKKPRATNRWTLQACADNRKKRALYLCNKHDMELNATVLRFFRLDEVEKKLNAYSEKFTVEASQ